MPTTHDSYQNLGVTFPEGVTRFLTIPLLRRDGSPLPEDELASIELTLWETRTGLVVNERDEQNVKNANGGTLTLGQLELELTPLDNTLVRGEAAIYERHVATLEWVATDGTDGKAEIEFAVAALRHVS